MSDISRTKRCIWSLALVQYFLGIKVPTSFTAPLVPPHVLTEVLLSYHTTVHCPLVPHAFVGQSGWGWEGGEGEKQQVSTHRKYVLHPNFKSFKVDNNIYCFKLSSKTTNSSVWERCDQNDDNTPFVSNYNRRFGLDSGICLERKRTSVFTNYIVIVN